MLSNPAIARFAATLNPSRVFGQITIRRDGDGFEIRHSDDRDRPRADLEAATVSRLLELSAKDSAGHFRPLKSAPTLPSGWIARVADERELWEALHALYPGAVGDWYAALTSPSCPTSFREFVGRQTGMYRGAAKLTDAEVDLVTESTCNSSHCLKQRLWQGERSEAESVAADSLGLVCLEPCQLHLELSRRTFKARGQDQLNVSLSGDDIESILQTLNHLASHAPAPSAQARVADFSFPLNPRRLDLVRQRLQAQLPRQKQDAGE